MGHGFMDERSPSSTYMHTAQACITSVRSTILHPLRCEYRWFPFHPRNLGNMDDNMLISRSLSRTSLDITLRLLGGIMVIYEQ